MTLDLRTRHLQAELMDDPSLDGVSHEQALTGLRRINWWSRTDRGGLARHQKKSYGRQF
jgi:hypothetical protein